MEAYFSKKTHIVTYLAPPRHPPHREVTSDFAWALKMIGCSSSVFEQTGPSPSPACLRKFFPTLMPLFSDVVFHSGVWCHSGSDMLTGSLMGGHGPGLAQS